MTIQDFAAKYRLHTRLDDDQTTIIRGKFGHIFDYDDNVLGVMIMLQPRLKFPPPGQPQPPIKKPNYWGFRRSAFLHAGFTITQDGSYEGCATFDPQNPAQAKIAIKAAGIKSRRIPSPTEQIRLTNLVAKAREAKKARKSG